MKVSFLVTATAMLVSLILGAAKADSVTMPLVDNPYCSVPTYALPHLPEQARAFRKPNGDPAIAVSAGLAGNRPYLNFLMAHECCHHLDGHFEELQRRLQTLGARSFSSFAFAMRRMELDADCCAAKILQENGQIGSLDAAKKAMASFGGMPTGAYYPSGMERVYTLAKCAAEAAADTP
jgi:Zn-dependent protease with chaperone function